MTVADQISAARALIEPLTEYAPGPWKVDSDGDVYADNSFSIAQIWDIVEDFSEHAETKLILSAPTLRDTVAALADLADAQAQEATEWREEYRAVQGMNDLLRAANGKLIAEKDAQAQEIAKLRAALNRIVETPPATQPAPAWVHGIARAALGDTP